MKVVFVPDYRDKNSYQTNLSNSLSKQDVSIYFGNGIIKSVIMHKPDILHIHWPHPFMILANSKLGTIAKSIKFICELSLLKLFGIKIIWTVHNIVNHEGKFKSTELFFDKLFIRLCDKLIVHCSSAKTEALKICDKDDSSIIVIPHGNYIGLYKNVITSSEARNKLNFSTEDVVFLYFGQVREYKGIPELIKTFKKLNNKQTKLLIVGKPFNDEIAIDILGNCSNSNNIKNVLKFVPDDDIQIYMNAADVVVLPFKDILTSGSVVLSMSFGKPVIVPMSGCISDILDEKGSFLYSKTEEGGLLKAMQQVLNSDKEVLQNMGKHNFKLAEQFSWDEIGKRTYGAYLECLEK